MRGINHLDEPVSRANLGSEQLMKCFKVNKTVAKLEESCNTDNETEAKQEESCSKNARSFVLFSSLIWKGLVWSGSYC